jgi:hypothetical protein
VAGRSGHCCPQCLSTCRAGRQCTCIVLVVTPVKCVAIVCFVAQQMPVDTCQLTCRDLGARASEAWSRQCCLHGLRDCCDCRKHHSLHLPVHSRLPALGHSGLCALISSLLCTQKRLTATSDPVLAAGTVRQGGTAVQRGLATPESHSSSAGYTRAAVKQRCSGARAWMQLSSAVSVT